MLQLTNIEASIGGSRILRGVTLEVPDKSVLCLLGRNGVGKTTTLKTIVGALKPQAGAITLDGVSLNGLSPEARARHGIGDVPQGREIFPHLTVDENLKIGAVARPQFPYPLYLQLRASGPPAGGSLFLCAINGLRPHGVVTSGV